MGIIIVFAIGTCAGLIAAVLLQKEGCRAFFPYVVLGILGALAGGFMGARLLGFGFAVSGDLELEFLVLSAGGAMLALLLGEAGGRILFRGS